MKVFILTLVILSLFSNFSFSQENTPVKKVEVVLEQPKNDASSTSTLNFFIQSIQDMPSMDAFSETDCFIEVYVKNKLIYTSDMVKDRNAVVFNVMLNIKNYNNEQIVIKVYDKDVSDDEYMGKAVIDKPEEGQYPVIGSSRKSNSVERGLINIEIGK